jgi:DNA-binding MarR family transcriptional regulator
MAYKQLKLDNQLCFRLYTSSRLIVQAYEPFFKPLGITYTQYLVLMVLWEKDGQPVNDIGKRLLLGINTMSPLIKRMENMGLLTRRGNAADKRQRIVFLTEKGKQMEQRCTDIPGCLVAGLESCHLSPKKLLTIIPVLDEIIKNLGSGLSGKV